MEALSNETSTSQELARAPEQPQAIRPEAKPEGGPEVFAFDGWGMVPLELHPA